MVIKSSLSSRCANKAVRYHGQLNRRQLTNIEGFQREWNVPSDNVTILFIEGGGTQYGQRRRPGNVSCLASIELAPSSPRFDEDRRDGASEAGRPIRRRKPIVAASASAPAVRRDAPAASSRVPRSVCAPSLWQGPHCHRRRDRCGRTRAGAA